MEKTLDRDDYEMTKDARQQMIHTSARMKNADRKYANLKHARVCLNLKSFK